ncbi:MAG: hypothetical protein ACRDN0_11745 [Trebonia sp.]
MSIRLEILNLLDRLKRERNLALLYVTHDLATARHFSSRIMVMYRGQIVEHGPADNVILRPAHPYTQLLAAAAPNPGLPRAQLVEARRAREAARAAAASAAARLATDLAAQAATEAATGSADGSVGGSAAGSVDGSVDGSAGGTEAERREVLLDEGCRFRLRCPHAMDVCTTAPPDALVTGTVTLTGLELVPTPGSDGASGPGGASDAESHRALCWLHAPSEIASAAKAS